MNPLSAIIILIVIATVNGATMQLYEKLDGRAYQRVLVPVSSTVIPLDELPEYTVGAKVGFSKISPEGHVKKPEGEIKLVTANKKYIPKKDKIKKLYKSAVEEIFSDSN